MAKLRWGVLGAAKIARVRVIPAIRKSATSEVTAIASRDLAKASRVAAELGIEKPYGSYEELLADPEVDAIYNPLPNHLHVPWSIRAAEAGKHVLCEKPIGLSSRECLDLIDARERTGVCISEAFMVRVHPQWLRVREIVRSGEIGPLRAIIAVFSYFNDDPANIRNVAEWGGGALMDIGCYAVQIARFFFEREPERVSAAIELDPAMRVDRLTSGVLDFGAGHCVFTCGTQMAAHQRVHVVGTKARIEMGIPFNALADQPSRLVIDDGRDLIGTGSRLEETKPCDQYTLQADAFAAAIRGEGVVPTPLEDSLANMRTIEALFASARDGRWVAPESTQRGALGS